MGKYNIGEVWWIHFPFQDKEQDKRRPAIVIDDETIAILAMYVTSKNKENPYSIEIEDWRKAGLSKPSWTRIDRIVSISEWHMERKIGDLSTKDLTKIMQLVVEISSNKFHEFSLIVVKDPLGRYLQRYDDRWDCWLFPYTRSTDHNRENVDAYISERLQFPVETHYITNARHCKYSESDKVYKIYNHKLYEVVLDCVPETMNGDSFHIGQEQYKWMSIAELEQSEGIMKKNEDIVAFVKSKCS